MNISEFDYNLPEELIAQMPADKRENSKMMVLNKQNHTIEHKHFFDIVDYLNENDVLVLNNTKVIPARLFGVKEETGAKIEVFLLEAQKEGSPLWSCLIKPSKKVKPNTVINISDELKAIPIKRLEDDETGKHQFPYIERKLQTEEQKKFDMERYQTVYAKDEGSVAAPTAGLHFTDEILEKLQKKGVEIIYVTLNVGLGTFRPVKCENILDHKMHSETFEITKEAADAINNAKFKGKNIVAVGTTSVRTLETAYKKYGCVKECHDSSELFIYPPYEFKVVDKLITNFHLPKSTLLMLVSALAGKDFIFEAYNKAVENKYRFFSYGDCMLIQ